MKFENLGGGATLTSLCLLTPGGGPSAVAAGELFIREFLEGLGVDGFLWLEFKLWVIGDLIR